MKSTITIDVELDENKVPQDITWNATASTAEQARRAKAVMLSLWDGAERTALRIDLWTKEMMVDEMADFFYQSIMTMADAYGRATQYQDQVNDMKTFARDFYKKFQQKQLEQQKAT
ncbi:gliding motility protein GldC [Niabella ginsenosidivorans]|uniref:Gliding motility protein GldC n=1 Tax=Niabella ginsenosidivorans TaxID=1176587 RepID=A0A1A9I575_9BACT|nr:gliding motility protein GldC [Niabella ginsenosidivorans]ANH82837.1 gliding motility protein GldC [Niabella ginsenosidivorans]